MICPSHNPILPTWPLSRDFTVPSDAVPAGVCRHTWTVEFEDRLGAEDLPEQAKNFPCLQRLLVPDSQQLLRSRSDATRFVGHVQAG